MRWKAKDNFYPKYGARRMVTKFLLFPKEMEGEWRWLETASWMKEYRIFNYEDYSIGKWVDMNNEGWMDR
jgi:hypothetical protein